MLNGYTVLCIDGIWIILHLLYNVLFAFINETIVVFVISHRSDRYALHSVTVSIESEPNDTTICPNADLYST